MYTLQRNGDNMVHKYEDIRNQIKSGDLVFFHDTNTLTSKVVRFFTKGPYTHCGIAFWVEVCGKKRLMIAEAQGGTKRRILNLSYYCDRDFDVITSLRNWEDICDDALSNLGRVQYSWMEAAYVGVREFIKKYIELPHKDFDGQICSEYIADLQGLDKLNFSPSSLYTTLIDDYACTILFQVRK